MGTLLAAAQHVGENVASAWADEVDRDARFPAEAVQALREAGQLGALVPAEWGGHGASLADTSAAVATIAKHCSSSGLILAMHHIQAAMVARHGLAATRDALLPRVASGQLLLASANSEAGQGGGLRRQSICALEPTSSGFHLDKQASTVSYGEHADAILATARRAPDAQPHDQVLVVCVPPGSVLTPTGDWDSLGMRGTVSRPGTLVADVTAEMVIPDYAATFVRTALPTSAVLLASVWLGIAEAATERAHAFVRTQARQALRAGADAGPPPSALRLAELAVPLHQLRQVVSAGAADYDQYKDTPEIEEIDFSARMDNLKLSSSTLVVDIVQRAMCICGIAGYQYGNPFSVARLLRDAASAPLMVHNDRSLTASAHTLLVRRHL